jgi:hypothetical protein
MPRQRFLGWDRQGGVLKKASLQRGKVRKTPNSLGKDKKCLKRELTKYDSMEVYQTLRTPKLLYPPPGNGPPTSRVSRYPSLAFYQTFNMHPSTAPNQKQTDVYPILFY